MKSQIVHETILNSSLAPKKLNFCFQSFYYKWDCMKNDDLKIRYLINVFFENKNLNFTKFTI